ncbi:MAG: master DNA invertase Mpi family serine-type recombinase [Helicobacteraceae bacterium]|jgi:DNA invertase Pin-like site-specific DNA recombinase|nr:master DNA invertase Mpi family serine-type recombinase [Helicobacteraceae bacterium]
MNYGYIRVSSERQNTENQRFEIERFAALNKIVIDRWIEEKISAKKELKDRKFGKLLRWVKEGDLIVSSELSRFGRNLFQIMSVLNLLLVKGAKVLTIKDGYKLGDDISSKVLAFAFSLAAEIERDLISRRTKEALAKRKADGVRLGRPKGQSNTLKLSGRESEIAELLRQKLSKSAIASRLKVHRNTLVLFLKRRGADRKL